MTCTRCKNPKRFAWASTFGARTETLCAGCRREWHAFIGQALHPTGDGEVALRRAREAR